MLQNWTDFEIERRNTPGGPGPKDRAWLLRHFAAVEDEPGRITTCGSYMCANGGAVAVALIFDLSLAGRLENFSAYLGFDRDRTLSERAVVARVAVQGAKLREVEARGLLWKVEHLLADVPYRG